MRTKQTFDSFDVLYVELTNRCNFNCVHCGNEPDAVGDIEYSQLEKILAEFNVNSGKKLILTGGEPLMHPKIREILDLTSSHAYHTKLSTNAHVLNKPEFGYVFDYDIGFRVSLDGTREIHNKIRRNPGAYDSLVSAMKKMSEHERQIVIRTTVMKTNADSIVDMLYELDRLTKEENLRIYSNNIWPMRNIGKADEALMLTSSEYGNFLSTLNQKTRSLHSSFRIIVGPTFGYEPEFIGGPLQSNEIYKCDILNTSLHVAYNGDIYPCSFIHYPLGNISEIHLKDVFRSDKAVEFRKLFLDKESHDCNGCNTYESCKGGCIAEKYHLLIEKKEKVMDIYCFRQH